MMGIAGIPACRSYPAGRPRRARSLCAPKRRQMLAQELDHFPVLVRIDVKHSAHHPHRCAGRRAVRRQRADVLGQAAAAEAAAAKRKDTIGAVTRARPRMSCSGSGWSAGRASRRRRRCRRGSGKVGELVGERDQRRQQRVRGVLDHLCGRVVRPQTGRRRMARTDRGQPVLRARVDARRTRSGQGA